MIWVYVTEIRGLQDPKEIPELLDIFPEDRRKKILSYGRKMNRLQSYGASLLLRRILQENGKSMDDVFYSETGKPMIDGLFFSISHSADKVMCAVSSKRVGCDIEKIKEDEFLEQRFEKIVGRFFSKKEKECWRKIPQEKRIRMFYQIWTMKESYVKMTGEGLKVPLANIEFEMNHDNARIYRDGELCECVMHTWEMDGYRMSVCGEEESVELKNIRVYNY